MGMEVCCTLGMLEEAQAKALKQAGLTAYNHNLDTSREFYPSVITTRSYDERLDTLAMVRAAGISVCSGEKEGMCLCPSCNWSPSLQFVQTRRAQRMRV